MKRYLLWAVDSDGVIHLKGSFSSRSTALMFGSILHTHDEYRDFVFYVEEL